MICPTHDLLWPPNRRQTFSSSEVQYILDNWQELMICGECFYELARGLYGEETARRLQEQKQTKA